MAHTTFLAGGIASGKSTVARLLHDRGAWLCDLDQVSREVLEAGSPVLESIATEFGDDLVDRDTGELNRDELAARAFATPEDTARLEAIEMPAIRERLAAILTSSSCSGAEPKLTIVEVPLLDRVEDLLPLADDVLVVTAPLALRRKRAIGRGMTGEDFDARAARQPSDEYLRAHATHVIENDGDAAALEAAVGTWWLEVMGE
ncbi:MAG: dephospho-CoA kinase [Parolsenella sp.]|uniref:dephospho-CoA kinase n=1 Tax=Parolsenella sp. TaxID=2083006 RepID=UPI002A762554|nr:dephospho-CoA kinase [Parolsenella sp.]MDY3292825.1 dephospho-CoA kinase [Parolsenella sp.]